MASNLHFCFVLISTWLAHTSSRKLCPRIFFQNINEETMPYKIIEGVYVYNETDNYNNFPVYRREGNNDLGLFLDNTGTEKGNKRLVFGQKHEYWWGSSFISRFGVAANLSGDPSSWLSSGTLNRIDVFGGLVQQWQYYNRSDQTDYDVPVTASSPMIKAVCVDEDFRECNSDRLYLNEHIYDEANRSMNDPKRDYFFRIKGYFINLRPVYKHSSSLAYGRLTYLQYVDGHWVISKRKREWHYFNAMMKVKDLALRPEYITNTWWHWSNVFRWRNMPSVRILCRGITSTWNRCPLSPCKNKATCVYTSGKETVCLCTSGFTGLTCSVNKQCPTPHPEAGKELDFKHLGRRHGDLGMSFCSGSYPATRFYLCLDSKSDDVNSSWSGQGPNCTEKEETSSTTPTPTIKWPIPAMTIVFAVIISHHLVFQ